MYPNLKAEMARNGITISQIAEKLNITLGTASEKLSRYNRLRFCESVAIRDAFFPNLSIDYLFATSGSKTA